MSWFSSEQHYDAFPEQPEVSVTVNFHYPDDDSTPSAPVSDSGFDTPENYRSMIYDDILQNTR